MTVSIETVVGKFQAGYRGGKLTVLQFPDSRGNQKGDAAARRTGPGDNGDKAAAELRTQLEQYFRGGRRTFAILLDLSAGTEFQRRVWRAMLRIPFGKTKSYGEIAREIGSPRAARAVGMACGANPIPILVPCHRVLAHGKKLGGFSSGLHWKKRLLALESKKA